MYVGDLALCRRGSQAASSLWSAEFGSRRTKGDGWRWAVDDVEMLSLVAMGANGVDLNHRSFGICSKC